MKQIDLKTVVMLALMIHLNSCGFLGIGESDEGAGDLSNPINTGTETTMQFSITADYAFGPVDVVVMKDNNSTINANQNPFANRLYRDNNEVTRGFQEFAIRLYFSELDFRLGFVETMFASDADADEKAGNLLLGVEGDDIFFTTQSPRFVDEVVERSAIAPGAEVSEGVARGNPNFFYPMLTIQKSIEIGGDPLSPTYQFLRPGAHLSIVYVGISDPIKESIETSDIIALLDENRGAGNWTVNVLGVPREGCEWEQTDSTRVHTNQSQYYANSDDPAVYTAFKRRNKMLKLQEASDGIFTSICEESYLDFMQRAVTEGTKSGFFSLTPFTRPVIEGTLEVKVNGNAIEGWRYREATQTLLLPTTIPVGTQVDVTYKTPVQEGDRVFESPVEQVEEIPEIREQELTPSQLTFLNSIRNIFQNNGCIGCHSQYSEYDAAWDNRNQILERISLDDSNPLSMPQNSTFDSAVNKQAVIDWINAN